MLSTAVHHYPTAFTPLPSSTLGVPPPPIDPVSMQLNHHNLHIGPKTNASQRHHPYDVQQNSLGGGNVIGSVPSRTSGTSGPIRRRISRACDQCNQLRTKCSGKLPCQHCIDFSLKCEYARERKKRGKASRKDIQAAQAAAAAAAAAAHDSSVPGSRNPSSASPTGTIRVLSGVPRHAGMSSSPKPDSVCKEPEITRTPLGDLHDLGPPQMHHVPTHHPHHSLPTPESPSHLQIHHHHQGLSHDGLSLAFDRMSPFSHQVSSNVLGAPRMLPQPISHGMANGANSYGNDFVMLSPHHAHPISSIPSSATSPLTNLLGHDAEAGSPPWISMPSPPQPAPLLPSNIGIRYPVLLPLLPQLSSIISPLLACDLLDLYFQNPSTAFFQPASPYVLVHIFRKRSFLHPTSPRPTSPALLCAMLWVAAQTSDAAFLTTPPTVRARVCQRLLELCIELLRPLVHVNIGSHHSTHANDNESANACLGLGGLGDGGFGRDGFGAAGTLDDVLTYIHLGIVTSASEFKSASLRWWTAAWTLARELHLNREISPHDMDIPQPERQRSPADNGSVGPNISAAISGEEKEERRRTWWLLYVMDRHLALCFNKPLVLLDVECANLCPPMDEASWQNGDYYHEHHHSEVYSSHSPSAMELSGTSNRRRTTGVAFQITGPGLFEFFLPLMAILGQIVELQHARNRLKFCAVTGGRAAGGATELDERINEIRNYLELYERSLQDYEAAHMSGGTLGMSSNGVTTPTIGNLQNAPCSQGPEPDLQTKVVVAYGMHVMHVLHILLAGKWDPVSMLDDSDLWTSSPGFLSATAHAVSASEALNSILKYDPDLSFMPYFFEIYLLQGSFLLLLIADKLGADASEAVITACQTVTRAHEVCVVTSNTKYQRNFRSIMGLALAQLRERVSVEDFEEQKFRRRRTLLLYRWCGDGTGLAL